VWPQAVLGGPPQSTRHKGGRTTLVIGRNCLIREGVTMNLGTDSSRGETSVGDNGQFFAYAHIAHDCVIGESAIFANGVTLGGHVEVGRNVYIGGLTAVHQFVRIGDRAFVGGCSAVVGDVVPFAIAAGNRAKLRGPNAVGLKRSGMARSELFALRDAYKMIFDPARPLPENIELTRSAFPGLPSVAAVLDFLTSRGKRHLTTPPRDGSDAGDDDGEAG
jgi:UDP-N-acetylglucosamine acyltransferase